MRMLKLKQAAVLLLVCAVMFLLYSLHSRNPPPAPSRPQPTVKPPEDMVHVATAVCEEGDVDLLHELIKTALFSSQHVVSFNVFTPPRLLADIKRQSIAWPFAFARKLELRIYAMTLPEGWHRNNSSQLLCDIQPFLLTVSLPHLKRVLWMHVDTLFLAPLEFVWNYFNYFDPLTTVACTTGIEALSDGSYRVQGVRTEVLLLNLAEMRRVKWANQLLKELETTAPRSPAFRAAVDRHFLSHPQRDIAAWLPCETNFGSELCPSLAMCKSVRQHGILVLRGAGSNTDPVFSAVLQAVKEFRLGVDCNKKLPFLILKAVSSWTNITCGFRPKLFVQQINGFILHLSQLLPDTSCFP